MKRELIQQLHKSFEDCINQNVSQPVLSLLHLKSRENQREHRANEKRGTCAPLSSLQPFLIHEPDKPLSDSSDPRSRSELTVLTSPSR